MHLAALHIAHVGDTVHCKYEGPGGGGGAVVLSSISTTDSPGMILGQSVQATPFRDAHRCPCASE